MKRGKKKLENKDNSILVFALVNDYIKIQNEKLEPIFETIEKKLHLQYPKMSEDQITDWTCDLVSCSNSDEVKRTMKRMVFHFTQSWE